MTTSHLPHTRWAKDHWSLLAYIETVCVDYAGACDMRRMRCNKETHAVYATSMHHRWTSACDTRVRDEHGGAPLVCIPGHDDWDVVADFVHENLIKVLLTAKGVTFELTDKGRRVAHALREHKMCGKTFGEFRMPDVA